MPRKDHYRSIRKAFIDKLKPVLAELEAFNENEHYYRRCYELRDDARALGEHMEAHREAITTQQLIPPWGIAEGSFLRIEEDLLFNHTALHLKTRNVFLRKHDRYSPVFEHIHGYFETFFVFQGRCTNIIGGKRIAMGAGQLCFIAPNTHHALEVTDDHSIIINILIRKSTFDEIFFSLLTTGDILSKFFLGNLCSVNPIEYLIFDIAGDPEMTEWFLTLLVEQSHDDLHSARIMDNLISVFFSLLVRKYGNNPIAYEQTNAQKTRHWDMITYIYENFRTISLAKTAKRFNLSVAHCSRLIKAVTGKSFSTLIRDIRMKQAEFMLASSKTRIYDISYFLGYENQETFIRAFKKWHGLSPALYRKEHAKTPSPEG
jgi:AraC-like DNA-binding protein/quercetin dioxygenase-like cupin family protein